jgi:hypothetical protein
MRNHGRSIHFRHLHVAEDGRDAGGLVILLHEFNRGLTALGQKRMVTGSLEHQLERISDIGIVIDNQNRMLCHDAFP